MITNNYEFGRKGHGYEDEIVRDLTKRKVPFLYEPFGLEYFIKVPRAECDNCGSKEVYTSHTYYPDFVSADESIIVEAKGKFTPAMRKKMLSVIENHPQYDIRILFMRDNWLTKRHVQHYTDWCRDHNIKCAVGLFPSFWKKEFKEAARKTIDNKRGIRK